MNGRFRLVLVGAVCFVLVGLAPAALAQALPDPPASQAQLTGNAVNSDLPPRSPEWGTSAPIALLVPGWTFNPTKDGQYHQMADGYIYKYAGFLISFSQTLQLPSGAWFAGVTPLYDDTDPGADISLNVIRWRGTATTGFTSAFPLSDTSTGSGGYQGEYHPLDWIETVRNVDPATGEISMYQLEVGMDAAGPPGSLAFGGVVVWYQLQVSPAPATATFSDVPTGHWAFQYIEALVASGITAGCGGGKYCPDNPITRAQMAVFLADALGLHWPDGSPQ